MFRNLSVFLWALKFGAVLNIYFFVGVIRISTETWFPQLVIPAGVFFFVSAYRCLFPVRYKNHIVFHDVRLSSIFITRLLATFSEIASIYLLASVLRQFNMTGFGWVEVFSSTMIVLVVISQFFVWGSILTGRLILFVYEEIGWFLIYGLNAVASLFLYKTAIREPSFLLVINILFGLVYLPWQLFHLRDLYRSSQGQNREASQGNLWSTMQANLYDAIYTRRKTTDSEAWGGLIGITWMTSYWAVLIPLWVFLIVNTLR